MRFFILNGMAVALVIVTIIFSSSAEAADCNFQDKNSQRQCLENQLRLKQAELERLRRQQGQQEQQEQMRREQAQREQAQRNAESQLRSKQAELERLRRQQALQEQTRREQAERDQAQRNAESQLRSRQAELERMQRQQTQQEQARREQSRQEKQEQSLREQTQRDQAQRDAEYQLRLKRAELERLQRQQVQQGQARREQTQTDQSQRSVDNQRAPGGGRESSGQLRFQQNFSDSSGSGTVLSVGGAVASEHLAVQPFKLRQSVRAAMDAMIPGESYGLLWNPSIEKKLISSNTDPVNMGLGYCTDYVKALYKITTGNDLRVSGNAGQWFSDATSKKMKTLRPSAIGHAPEGAVLVWRERGDLSGVGHVATVVHNDSARQIIHITESNWGGAGPTAWHIKNVVTAKFGQKQTTDLSYANALSRMSGKYELQGFILPQ